MGKIIEVCFQPEDEYYKRASESKLTQWSYGHILRIIGLDLPDSVEIHFSLDEKNGEAPAQIGRTVDGITEVEIPSFIMEGPAYITNDYYKAYAFIFVSDKDFGETVRKIEFNIRARSKSTNSVPEPQQDEFLNTVREIMQETKDIAQSVRNDADNGAFIGPQGPQRKQGLQGIQGPKGAPGEIDRATFENFAIKQQTDPATSLHIQDSARYRVPDVSMDGKMEQNTTTGKNLFDYDTYIAQGDKIRFDVEANKVLYRNSKLGALSYWGVYDAENNLIGTFEDYKFTASKSLTLPANASYIYVSKDYVSKTLYIGYDSDTTYEPYTGGIPSPNTDFPQEIVHAGTYNSFKTIQQ